MTMTLPRNGFGAVRAFARVVPPDGDGAGLATVVAVGVARVIGDVGVIGVIGVVGVIGTARVVGRAAPMADGAAEIATGVEQPPMPPTNAGTRTVRAAQVVVRRRTLRP
jgi:hypothetical protein